MQLIMTSALSTASDIASTVLPFMLSKSGARVRAHTQESEHTRKSQSTRARVRAVWAG
jgi:hypothetical protein